MILKKVKISNFRCFGPEESVLDFENFTAIIGTNSSGKTAVMQALLKIFGESNAEKEINRADFHVPFNINPDQLEQNQFSVEAIFEFPEATKADRVDSIPLFFEHFVVRGTGLVPSIRILLEANWKKGNSPEGSIDFKLWYVDACEPATPSETNKKPVSKHDLSHIKVIYVPALRNPSSQLKNSTGTLLWRVLKGINWSDSYRGSLAAKMAELNSLFSEHEAVATIKETINSQWLTYHNDLRYNEAAIIFNSTTMENALKKVEVEFSPTEVTNSYTIDALGDGLRSLFYFSMVNSLLEIEDIALQTPVEGDEEKEQLFNIDPVVLTIVIVEEPENHIAPQILGKVIQNLRKISVKKNAQTIITSHTPAIIKRVDPTEIRHFRICNIKLSTVIQKIELPEKSDEAYQYVKEAVKAYPELYFARLVVLGEGDSEEIVIPRVIELLGQSVDSSGVSIVPLGGRHVNHFWRLLNQLNIPFITLLDLDRERSGGGWGRIKYVFKELLKIGYDRETLLNSEEGVLTEERFEGMHEWDTTKVVTMNGWLSVLEQYGVYFSTPLDLDFSMIESFLVEYQSILASNEGPYIKGLCKISDLSEADKQTSEYIKRVEHDVRATLKLEGEDGSTYSLEQRELMIWYNYFFLNRGKPTTHFLAMANITDILFKDKLPNTLLKLQSAILHKLMSDPYSSLTLGGKDG